MLDTILIVILVMFVSFGFWFGFVHALGALIGVVAGAFFAGRSFEPLAQWLHSVVGGSLNIERVIVFILIFTIINRLIGFIFWIVERIFKIATMLPFLKTIDRVLGAAFAFLEGAFVLGLTLSVALHFKIPLLQQGVAASGLAQTLVRISRFLEPLLPAALRLFNIVI